jgi:DNA-binding MarR family transcriptional regulator
LASTHVLPPSVDAVTDALLTASRALVAVAARSLDAIDEEVTLPQYRALVVLAAHGTQHVGELAAALGIQPSTATRLCDRLVARKLVRRAVSRSNRRETEIALTATGRKLVDRVTALRRRELARIVARIPGPARAATVEALNAFADAAGEVPDQAWSLGWS